jgi:hypothetical protein
VTPAFSFVSVLRARTSSFIHSRRTAVFYLEKSSILQSKTCGLEIARCAQANDECLAVWWWSIVG